MLFRSDYRGELRVALYNESDTDYVIHDGDRIALPSADYVALICARSGLASKHGITMANGVGVIDSAYGGELKDVVTEVTALYPDGVKVLTPAELDFSYRHSVFSAGEGIVLGAKVKLESGDPDAIKAKMDDLMARRKASQPDRKAHV